LVNGLENQYPVGAAASPVCVRTSENKPPEKGVAADRGLLVNAAPLSRRKSRQNPRFSQGPKQDTAARALPPGPLLYKRAMSPHKTSPKGNKDRRHFYPKPAGKPAEQAGRAPGKPPSRRESGSEWLYGLHAVQAALANPNRKLGRAALTPRAVETIGKALLGRVQVETMEPGAIDRLLPAGAVHQGAALEAWPLKSRDLDEILESQTGQRRIILVLDQLSDPHNVGAILRTAAAFGVTAVVVQDRHAPPQSGALAKAASGALDMIPYVEVVNIARTLDQLAERGFWRIALAGDGETSLAEAVPVGDVALVLGSEGDGIRRLVREHCEASAFIPIGKSMESLNVSNAAAIALYELRRG
jgi:23S rRNA (guanosine2251-2'-O)-methyltransferase